MYKLLIHFSIFGAYLWTIIFDPLLDAPPSTHAAFIMSQIGGRYKFLTFLNMLLQCGYFLLATSNDLIGSDASLLHKQSFIQKLRDWLFSSLVFPLACCVSALFWGIYAVDRELIFPESMDSWFSPWKNHVMHTLPIIGVMLDIFLSFHTYQRRTSKYYPVMTVYVLYLSWICYIASVHGFWVYPVFEALPTPTRTLFFVFLSLPPLIFYKFGEVLHHMVWGSGRDKDDKKV